MAREIRAAFLADLDVPDAWLRLARELCREHHWAHHWLWEAYQVLTLLDASGLTTLEGLEVLEPGCSWGVVSCLLALKGAKVTLLDYSLEELEKADRVAKRLGIDSSVTLVQGDLFAMPFEDARFDLVWNDGVIEHFDVPLAALQEMVRHTRPEGRVLIAGPAKWTLHTLFLREWRRRRGAYDRFDGWGKERSYSAAELSGLLEKAGLVETGTVTCNVRENLLGDYLVMPTLWRLSGGCPALAYDAIDWLEMRTGLGRLIGHVAAAIGRKASAPSNPLGDSLHA